MPSQEKQACLLFFNVRTVRLFDKQGVKKETFLETENKEKLELEKQNAHEAAYVHSH